jgi:hypothetical protein
VYLYTFINTFLPLSLLPADLCFNDYIVASYTRRLGAVLYKFKCRELTQKLATSQIRTNAVLDLGTRRSYVTIKCSFIFSLTHLPVRPRNMSMNIIGHILERAR